MRTPVWESAPGALAVLLNSVASTQLRMVDLYGITTRSGSVLQYSAGDEEVQLGTSVWTLGPILRRGRTRLTGTIEVDTLNVTISAPPSIQINGVPMMHFITAGGLDDARVVLWRVFSAGPGMPWVGALHMFGGLVGEVKGGRHEKKLSVRSDLDLLNANVPRNVYQPACLNNIYDPRCGVSRGTFQVEAVATTVSDPVQTTFGHNQGSVAADLWTLGELVFLTGANTGVRRTVSAHDQGTLTVIEPWPFPVAIGDRFNIWPGCDRTRGTCISKFNNLGRFRGMPFIPIAETVI